MNRSRTRQWWVSLVAVVAALLSVALLATGCGGVAGKSGLDALTPREPRPAGVDFEPAPGAKDVNPAKPATITVHDGHLEDIALTNSDGRAVNGRLSAGGRSWSTIEALGYGKTYTWSGKVARPGGQTVTIDGSFDTLSPNRTVRATVNPIDHSQVGIAMPISVKFDEPVKDRAAAQRALSVHTSVPVEGAWAWLSDTQVDWRPKQYWPAGTNVSVHANLYGVPYGDGAYGKSDLTSDFTIGRAQVVKADTRTHEMVVQQDGKEIARYQASYGAESDPERNTPNGTYMVMEKHPVEKMDNPRYGYHDVMKKWAVRISNHGEYIHENEENRANIGKVNNTHGCVNLTEADAKKYFDSVLTGDPVEVVGSATTMPPIFDVYDWLLPWDQWKAKSAL